MRFQPQTSIPLELRVYQYFKWNPEIGQVTWSIFLSTLYFNGYRSWPKVINISINKGILTRKAFKVGPYSLKIIYIINDNYCHSIESVISFTWFDSRLKETRVPTDCIYPPRTHCWQPCRVSQPNRRNNNGETTTWGQKKENKEKGYQNQYLLQLHWNSCW